MGFRYNIKKGGGRVFWEFGASNPSKPLKCIEKRAIIISVHLSFPFIYLIYLISFMMDALPGIYQPWDRLKQDTTFCLVRGCIDIYIFMSVCLFVHLSVQPSFRFLFCLCLWFYIHFLFIFFIYFRFFLFFWSFWFLLLVDLLQVITFGGESHSFCSPPVNFYIRPWWSHFYILTVTAKLQPKKRGNQLSWNVASSA